MKPILPPKFLIGNCRRTYPRYHYQGRTGAWVQGLGTEEGRYAGHQPVREALALLQIVGLIRVLPKRGSFVFTLDEKTVSDLCDHRAILESACLDFAIHRNHGRLMAGLQQTFSAMQSGARQITT